MAQKELPRNVQEKARNDFYNELMKALAQVFGDKYQEDMFMRVGDGVAFQLPDDPDGNTFAVAKLIIKKEGYDIHEDNAAYLKKIEDNELKAKEAAAKKEAAQKKREAEKARKEAEKAKKAAEKEAAEKKEEKGE